MNSWKTKIVVICLIYSQIASYFDASKTWTRKPICFTHLNLVTWPSVKWLYFCPIFHWNGKKTYRYQRRRNLFAFQWGVNQVSIISSSWDLLNENIFIGRHSTGFGTFSCKKTYHHYVACGDASKHYYVTKEITKRWCLFDIVLLLASYVFCYVKYSVFLSIFCCFYLDIAGLR